MPTNTSELIGVLKELYEGNEFFRSENSDSFYGVRADQSFGYSFTTAGADHLLKALYLAAGIPYSGPEYNADDLKDNQMEEVEFNLP